MKKNRVILLSCLIFVLGLGSLYQFWWWPQYQARETKVGSDSHGCATTFEYYWCEAKKRCLRASDEDCLIEEGVKKALSLKYKKAVTEILIEIKKQSAHFAEGRVWLGDKAGEGYRWLAAKPQETWEIVYDGQGKIDCPKITKQYVLPASVLQGFCD